MNSPGPCYQPMLALLRASEAVWEASRILFSEWDLSPSQFNILNLLHENQEGLSQAELGRRLVMHRSNITGLLSRLERRKLVQRRRDPDDARAFRVVLAARGRVTVQKIRPGYYTAAESLWAGIAPRRAERLLAELQKLEQNARHFSEANRP